MSAAPRHVVDAADRAVRVGHERIDKGRFSDARVPDSHCRVALQASRDLLNRHLVAARLDNLDIKSGEVGEKVCGVLQIGFRDAQDGVDSCVEGRNEIAVDEPGSRLGVGRGDDDEHLVGVGDDDALHRIRVVGAATKQRAALLHADDAREAAVVAARVAEPLIESGTDPLGPTILVDGLDASVAIRSDEVNAGVSPVSAVPAVRARLLELQRAIIGDGGIVVEGRDIGSVVAPDAPVKIYLSAHPQARAVRRAAEAGGDVAATQESLLARDRIDSGRTTAPLVMADGAVHIDTTPYTLDQVISQVVALVEGAEARA